MFWFHYGVGILIYQPDDNVVCIKNGDLNATDAAARTTTAFSGAVDGPTTTFSATVIIVYPCPCLSPSLAACLMPASCRCVCDIL